MNIHTCLLFLVVCWPGLAITQATHPDDPYAEQTIRNTLALNGVSPSFVEKDIGRLGDRAAIGLMRVLSEEPLVRPDQLKNILSILRDAFRVRSIISNEADRQPKATLFLLNCLQEQAASRDLRDEISETRTFVSENMKRN